ncbi:hypothetical protein Zmor_026961 [Zophobas morio]|uniref:Uncharacterized protein n=1 Tax=Zophobas morio TaxID=2755281 RepID=A0AA38HVP3_9CUCU|nr:hypothetical protein Zmor_026961 [Zophobas morio]
MKGELSQTANEWHDAVHPPIISPFRDGAHTVLANSRTGRTNVLYKLMNNDIVIALNVRLIRNIILFAFLTTSTMCSDHKREDDTITPRSR